MDDGSSVESLKVNWLAAAGATLGILAVTGAGIALLITFRPRAEKAQVTTDAPAVVVEVARKCDVTLPVSSQGIVEPLVVTRAASEVAGQVVWVAPNFRRGAVVKEGEELLRIDPSDYEAAVAQAEASHADAQLDLELEQAKAKQAAREWQNLSQRDEPSDLVLRKPQLRRAESRRDAAHAALAQARRDLERTLFRAPYDGRVRATETSYGSFVTGGSPLAELYATDIYEVRLPLSFKELGYVARSESGAPIGVSLTAAGGGEWRGKITRREGEIDRRTRSVYLVAELEGGGIRDISPDPADLLMPGRFVDASIDGEAMRGVVALRSRALYDGGRVLVLDGGDKLRFRRVNVVRTLADQVFIDAGLEHGDQVCVTPLALPYDGMPVRPLRGGDTAAIEERVADHERQAGSGQ